MRYVLLFSLLALLGCGAKPMNIDFGKSTTKDLISERGEAIEIQKPAETKAEIHIYENNDKFQISNDVVTHGFTDPKGDARSLLYWRHKFKECDTSEKIIAVPKGHELPEYEFKCAEKGITIIFTKDSESVSRVIYHEKK